MRERLQVGTETRSTQRILASFRLLANRRFQPGEGPSRGDCTTSPINRFAALLTNDGLMQSRGVNTGPGLHLLGSTIEH